MGPFKFCLSKGILPNDITSYFSVFLLQVKCDMSYNPPRTIIEHNYPRKTEVKDALDGTNNGNTYNIEYVDINKDQLVALIQRQTCSQALR